MLVSNQPASDSIIAQLESTHQATNARVLSGSNALSADIQPPLLSFDELEFAEKFNRRPFLISHRLAQHPLFELPRLIELAQSLPESHIEYNAGTLPVNQDPALTPRNGLSAQDTLQRIEECRSWMAIKNVEFDPVYRSLLEECLAEIHPHSEPIVPGMMNAQGFIFVTSPGSITPYHFDPEHNFLLQLRGHKFVRLFDGLDPDILSQEELERFYGEKRRNFVLKEENREKCWVYELQSGQGLHFPVTFPHWVQNGSEVSVSFSITFRTPDLQKRSSLYAANYWLRRRGLRPSPVGQSPWSDQLKYQTSRVVSKLQSWTGLQRD